MSARLESFTTLIRPDQAVALHERSRATRTPIAVCVRAALDLWLAARDYPRSWVCTRAGRDAAAADGVFAGPEVGR